MSDTPILTIAIPTYNRPHKLNRLLQILKEEIIRLNLISSVRISVSDNSENSESTYAFENIDFGNIDVEYFRQVSNVGFDRNLTTLYNKCTTQYIWFISDDDIPLPDGIRKIVESLINQKPDLLLFSFSQPPGSKIRTFDYKTNLQLIDTPVDAISVVIKYPKISIYILKKIEFTNIQKKFIEDCFGDGWIFIILSLSVLANVLQPKVAIISEILATADEDYSHIWVPTPFLHMYKIAYHPYIKQFMPQLEEKLRIQGYIDCIKFSWALKLGVLTLDDKDGLDEFIRKMNWNFEILLCNPILLLQIILLKSGLVPVISKLKKFKLKFLK